FIGVRKDRGAEQKQHFYDPENLTLSYSFNEVLHHDYEIEGLLDQQLRTSADYAYTFKPKPVEPFKNTKFMKKSNYWKMLSEFNFNFLPTSINFSSTILRQYNKQQFRQIDVEGIGLDPLYKRNYMFNYNYGFNYNLTKSLRFNYTATTANLVRNYLDANNDPIDDFTIWDDYWNIGIPNQHAQQLTVNYDLPINKIPALAFIKSDYTYTGDYTWQKSSMAASSFLAEDGVTYNLGNTIQNANSHKLNTALNMDLFYKYIGFVKRGTKKPAIKVPVAPAVAPKPGEKIVAKPKVKESQPNVLVDGLIGIATSIKNIQINYSETNGTMLPGYLPTVGFLGSTRPSAGFVFGLQDDVRFEAAKNGWLTDYGNFNQNFTQVKNRQITGTANVELFPDLKIDLIADRMYADNFSEQYDAVDNVYHPHSSYNYGNFSVSTVLIKTAFSTSDEISSPAFQEFRDNRLIVANRLATEHYGTPNFPVETNIASQNYGYPIGYGRNNQAVLLPSFLAAYSGGDASGVSLDAFRKIPIPNWTIKYTGLMRYKFFKDKFKRFSLQHGYKAAYTMNSYRSNFKYGEDPSGLDAGGNFNNQIVISNINLTEQFSPLVRIDFEMKNAIKILAEMKKDRTLALSFDNNLLTELKGVEYVIGLGYRIKDVTIRSKLADNATGMIKSDINLRSDVSFRNNKTIVRNLDYDNNQLAGGQNIVSAKLTADYAFSKSLTTLFYFDYSFSKAVISTAFPLTTIRAGFTLRYNFGN
ncbi:MAG: cell surface protein SprA, partial [Flavobacterium sp.]